MDTQKFIIGSWNSLASTDEINADYVRHWADAGITVAMSPGYDPDRGDSKSNLLEILDEAGRRGIKLLLCDIRTACETMSSTNDFKKRAAQAVEDFGGHPATFGFYISGEPEVDLYDDMVTMFRTVSDMAPNLTNVCNLLPCFSSTKARVGYDDWNLYLDKFAADTGAKLLNYDCYTQMWGTDDGMERYFSNLNIYSSFALKHYIPLSNVVLSTGHYRYRCPDENDLRWQLNTSVAHGAKGVFYFLFHLGRQMENYRLSPIDEHGERTETFGWLARVNKTFLKSTAAWFNELTPTRVTHFGKAYGGFELFGGTNLIKNARTSNNSPLILTELVDDAGGEYVAVTNNSMTESTQAEIAVNGIRPSLLINGWNRDSYEKTVFENIGLVSQGDDSAAVRFYLAPGQLTLFKVLNQK